MKGKLLVLGIAGLMAMAPLMSAAGASGGVGIQPAARGAAGAHPQVRYAVRYDQSPRLRDIRPVPPRAGQLIEIEEEELPNRTAGAAPTGSSAVQSSPGTLAASVLGSWDGVGNLDSVLPPDTNGDVGPNDYVQSVNLHYAVYSKSGSLRYGPVTINTLWSGFGGACETSNDGDPIVQYDHLADRWMISQFALPNFPFGPFYQCIAVSKTSDPTGAFNRYAFIVSDKKMNDYPKFGVWPDGYYMSINQYKQASLRWGGAGAVVFERDAMLAGSNARMVYFDLESVDSNLGGMLPSDLDGPAPPNGTPNVFAQFDDNAWGYSPDQVQLWDFHVNWSSPLSSTFTFDRAITSASFDSNMCGYNRNCVPQPGGVNIDAISDRLMYRLQYRSFGDHQTLVVNHTVDVNGSDRAGVRWYELRNSGAGWSIYQQGTYSPDSNNRWMGSAAMNGSGDLALGYSVSSGSVYPSVRFTGRLSGDPLGQMTVAEGSIVAGSGYQTHSSGRWGDYSMLAVDPVDDCTFWYTQEYYATSGTAPWRTRIGSFKLADCGATATATPGPSPTPTDTPLPTTEPTFTPTPTPTAVPPSPTPTATFGSGTMHIGDLDGASLNNGRTWTPVVTITVHDSTGTPLANATVNGAWSGDGSGFCTTNGSGQCSINGPDLRKNIGSIDFTVTGVSASGFTYDSSNNHDPDNDSDGTTITIFR
jgi:hypothetical protein